MREMAVLMACRSAGIDALDIVFSDINDKEGLEEDTALAKNLGFDGKTCIHPRQIDTVNSFFTPSMKEIKYALRVLQAVEEGKKQHKGAVTLDGGMIDKPMELRALTTLAQAKAAGTQHRRDGDLGGNRAERLISTQWDARSRSRSEIMS